ncbi:hypothetical protein CFD26_104647 [Aspergillus turcosus]|uniref:Uncharacterized protein n=1 Tax=Aspergillus turcosus TaxID=1245748 RepID=A0A421DCW3_9EURO|nr:hypothetical protein CFD26_104647 [Aspergillus turcosus]
MYASSTPASLLPQHRLLPLTLLPSLATTLVPSPLVYHAIGERSNAIADIPFVLHASKAIMPVPMCLPLSDHWPQNPAGLQRLADNLAQAQALRDEASEPGPALLESHPTTRSSPLPNDAATPQPQSQEDVLILENGVPCFISGKHWAWMAEEVRRTMNPVLL